MFDVDELRELISDKNSDAIILIKRGNGVELLDLNDLLFADPHDLYPIEETENMLQRLKE